MVLLVSFVHVLNILLHSTSISTQDDIVAAYLPRGFLYCGAAHSSVLQDVGRLAEALRAASQARQDSVLLYGPRGSGKSTMAAHLATSLHLDFVKVPYAKHVV